MTRYKLQIERDPRNKLAADLFSQIVFVCDGVLRIKVAKEATVAAAAAAARYLKIAEQLPIELQMKLCCCVIGSGRQDIPSFMSEHTFKDLAKSFSKRQK